MGLLDFGAKVVMTYRADVAQAKGALRELSGEEKRLAQERLAADEKANKGIERQIKAMGLLAAGIGAAIGMVALAKNGLDEYAKTSDHAAKKVAGIKDSASAAMSSVQASIGQTVMAMEPLISSVASLVKLLGDAGAAGPLAMSAIATAISGNPVIGALVLGGTSGGTIQGIFDQQMRRKRLQEPGALGKVANEITDTVNVAAGSLQQNVWGDAGKVFADGFKDGLRNSANRAKVGGGGGKASPTLYSRDTQTPYTDWATGGESATGALSQSMAADSVPRDEFGREIQLDVMEQYNAMLAEQAATAAMLAEINRDGPTVMERLLGTHDDMATYAAIFQGFSNTIQGTFDAIVTGTEPAAQALKRLAATGIMSIAKELLAGGIHYEAKVFGAIASQNYPMAAAYQVTAAKYFAGAAAVGVIASQMGGGGGGGRGGGGGSAPGYRPSAPSSYSSNNGEQRTAPIILVGSPFAYDSPRNQQKNAKRLTSMAYGDNAVSYG